VTGSRGRRPGRGSGSPSSTRPAWRGGPTRSRCSRSCRTWSGCSCARSCTLTEGQWDGLVVTGAALDVTGLGEYRVPFTLDVIASPPDRAGRMPDGVCPDCWGTGWGIDSDATMTGVLGGLFRCFCAGAWA
jgi:hypothetical protein